MADTIIPQSHSPSLQFKATPGVYHFAPDASMLDLECQLDAKRAQLHAMLDMGGDYSCGVEGGETLPNYFWACRMAAEEIAALTDELIGRYKSELAVCRGE